MVAVLHAGVSRIEYAEVPAWLKRYGGESRAWRLKALEGVAQVLDVPALRPPPHPVGATACALEAERLRILAGQGVPVPHVLAQGEDYLVLSDVGTTLSIRLRQSLPEGAARLFDKASHAIAEAHGRGAYLGQPLARNIAVDAKGRIGFLDFEEDPGQVMGLHDAQVRDWMLFLSGTARHVPQDSAQLAHRLRPFVATAPLPVRSGLEHAVSRLIFVEWISRLGGRRGAGLGKALRVLRGALATWAVAILLLGLGADYLHDGDIDLIQIIDPWID